MCVYESHNHIMFANVQTNLFRFPPSSHHFTSLHFAPLMPSLVLLRFPLFPLVAAHTFTHPIVHSQGHCKRCTIDKHTHTHAISRLHLRQTVFYATLRFIDDKSLSFHIINRIAMLQSTIFIFVIWKPTYLIMYTCTHTHTHLDTQPLASLCV